jgi:hypothetical protein
MEVDETERQMLQGLLQQEEAKLKAGQGPSQAKPQH